MHKACVWSILINVFSVHMFGHVSVYQETGLSGCLALIEFSHVTNHNYMVSFGCGPVLMNDYQVIIKIMTKDHLTTCVLQLCRLQYSGNSFWGHFIPLYVG